MEIASEFPTLGISAACRHGRRELVGLDVVVEARPFLQVSRSALAETHEEASFELISVPSKHFSLFVHLNGLALPIAAGF